ncbi:MAG: SWF/SNF helicase family protein [Saprospiraceae bacterium]|nr:SWF/SNF helicase family protein [Saprospiraceae bacterium]
MTKFNSDPDIKIFLMSLKAGGVGLNLTVANYVFILDPWWNPFAENQAIARAHRIGQTQKVNVIRFISKGSIEEKIIQLQQQKMVIANQLIDLGDQFLLQQENLKFILE